MKTATGKKGIIGTLIGLGTVGLLFGAMCFIRNFNQKGYAFDVNTAAKGIYSTVSTYMEEQNTLPDGVYTGVYDPDEKESKANAADSQASFTIPFEAWNNAKNTFYIMEIKDGKVSRVVASRSDCLQTDSLEPEVRESAPMELSLAEYYLNKYVGHYPDIVARST